MVNRICTSFWGIQFPTWSGSEEASSSPSENQTGEEPNILFEDLNPDAAERMISGEIECMSDGNLEQIMNEIDESYVLYEELDVRSLEDNWIMDGSFEAMASHEAAPVPDADGITDDVVTLSGSAESSPGSSCFTAWKRSSRDVAASVRQSQKLLKKALTGGALTNNAGGSMARAQESNGKGHVMSERRRREKLNEMFLILKSLLPSIHKVTHTIHTTAYCLERIFILKRKKCLEYIYANTARCRCV